jgi:hypothetical protein
MSEELWQNAVLSLIASVPPDPKPLASMLRSRNAIPAGIRDTLAELLDPGEPDYLGVRLQICETGEIKKNLHKFAVISGRSSAEERTRFRYKAYWRKLLRRLSGD